MFKTVLTYKYSTTYGQFNELTGFSVWLII